MGKSWKRYKIRRIKLANKRLQEPEIYMTKGYYNKELNKQDELNNIEKHLNEENNIKKLTLK